MTDESKQKRILKLGVISLGRACMLMLPTFTADRRVRLCAAGDPRFLIVIAGLDPAIHRFEVMDPRAKPAGDDFRYGEAPSEARALLSSEFGPSYETVEHLRSAQKGRMIIASRSRQ